MDRINRFLGIILLVVVGSAFASLDIAVIDFSGEMAVFYDPDSIHGYIHPISAIQNSFEILLDSVDIYNVREPINVNYFIDLPADLSVFNLVYILFGWEGSEEHVLTEDEMDALIVYILDGSAYEERSLIIEGNDFCENYGDTALTHYTYTPLLDYFASTLREPTGSSFDMLFGQIGSFAEEMFFAYPSGSGPSISPDDIIINEESPYSHQANYLFDLSTKSPARGMQRRGYTPGTAPPAGACVLLPIITGNLKNHTFTKTDLLYRMLDFVTIPTIFFTSSCEYEEVVAHSIQTIEFVQHDKIEISKMKLEYTTDGGDTWLTALITDPDEDFRSFDWTVPASPSDMCFLRIVAWDRADNVATQMTGVFEIIVPFDAEEENLPKTNELKAFPNPFNSTCSISLPNNFEGSISIYNLHGQEIFSDYVKSNSFIWSPTNIEAGLYMVQSSDASLPIIYIP